MITVAPADVSERVPALSLLFQHLPWDERLPQLNQVLEAAERKDIRLDGLLVARDASGIVGAMFIVLLSDGTAFVWPPSVLQGDIDGTRADALLKGAREWLDASTAKLAQCLLEPNQTAAQAILERNGFFHLTDLLFLRRTFETTLPSRAPFPLQATDYADDREADFAAVLARTYLDTLDCPRLSGVRSSHDALASHRLAGRFERARWQLFRRDGADVGLMLLSEHPEQQMWELVYMGLVPEMRGLGYGRAILTEGLWMAREQGAKGVFLAVDTANTYARAIYDILGFECSATRSVHMRFPPTVQTD